MKVNLLAEAIFFGKCNSFCWNPFLVHAIPFVKTITFSENRYL